MRPWVYVPGGIVPAAYKTYKRIYEEYKELIRHPRLSAIRDALLDECIRDIPCLLILGSTFLLPEYGIAEKAYGAFIASQIYLGASAGADSGFNDKKFPLKL